MIYISRRKYGPQRLDIIRGNRLYMQRWILWLGPLGSLRVHRFLRGDDDYVPHDHPWSFITFPLQKYVELVHFQPTTGEWRGGVICQRRIVKAWRFHFRRATHRHIVRLVTKPTWTIVIAGPKVREWGFWPSGDKFVRWQEWVGE